MVAYRPTMVPLVDEKCIDRRLTAKNIENGMIFFRLELCWAVYIRLFFEATGYTVHRYC